MIKAEGGSGEGVGGPAALDDDDDEAGDDGGDMVSVRPDVGVVIQPTRRERGLTSRVVEFIVPLGFDNSGEWNGHTNVFSMKPPEVK